MTNPPRAPRPAQPEPQPPAGPPARPASGLAASIERTTRRITSAPWFGPAALVADLLFGLAVVWLAAMYVVTAYGAATGLPPEGSSLPELAPGGIGAIIAVAIVSMAAALARLLTLPPVAPAELAATKGTPAQRAAAAEEARRIGRARIWGLLAAIPALLLGYSMGASVPAEGGTRVSSQLVDTLWVGGQGFLALIVGLAALSTLARTQPGEGVLRPAIAGAGGLGAVAFGAIWIWDAVAGGEDGPGFVSAAADVISAAPAAGTIAVLAGAMGFAIAGIASSLLAAIRLAAGRAGSRQAADAGAGRPAP